MLNQKIPGAGNYSGRNAEGFNWDLCIVMPAPPGQSSDRNAPQLIRDLNNANLETYQYFSVEKNEIICKIRASTRRLSEHAIKIGQKMLLDAKRLQDAAEAGITSANGDYIVPRLRIHHDPNITTIEPYQFIYSSMPNADPRVLPLFAHADGMSHPFGSMLRMKLLLSIISNDCGINLHALIQNGVIISYFPLRDEAHANNLGDKWLGIRVMPWQIPIDEIKDYFGEKIGFYFYFLAHYTTYLIPLAAVGVVVFIILLFQSNQPGGFSYALSNSFCTPMYCILVIIWGQVMFEMWKRREALKAMEWGMTGHTAVEQVQLSTDSLLRRINA